MEQRQHQERSSSIDGGNGSTQPRSSSSGGTRIDRSASTIRESCSSLSDTVKSHPLSAVAVVGGVAALAAAAVYRGTRPLSRREKIEEALRSGRSRVGGAAGEVQGRLQRGYETGADFLSDTLDQHFRAVMVSLAGGALAALLAIVRSNGSARSSGRSAAGAYEDRTRDELYELARQRNISGRASMSKDELISALRSHH